MEAMQTHGHHVSYTAVSAITMDDVQGLSTSQQAQAKEVSATKSVAGVLECNALGCICLRSCASPCACLLHAGAVVPYAVATSFCPDVCMWVVHSRCTQLDAQQSCMMVFSLLPV